MLRNILLISLLVYSVCGVHWEVREVDSAEDEFEDLAEDVTAEGPLLCEMCKKIMKWVKKQLSTKRTPDEIKAKLSQYCQKAGIFKEECNSFVQKHLHGLVDELMTEDGPTTICTKVKACKSDAPLMEFIFARDRAIKNF